MNIQKNGLVQIGGIIVSAVLIWAVVFSFSYNTFDLQIPLEITNLNNGLAIVEELTNVNIVVRAKNADISEIKDDNEIKATLDFKGKEEGNCAIVVEVTNNLEDAWVVDYWPKQFDLTLSESITKTIELSPELIGFPAIGYSVGEIKIIPNEVKVSGPNSLLNSLNIAFVGVDINGKNKTFSSINQPKIRGEKGDEITNLFFSPDRVSVVTEINKGDSFKTVGFEPTFTGDLVPGFWISLIEFDPPVVTIRGNSQKISEINSLVTTAINLNGKSKDFTDKISVDLPIGINLLQPNLINIKVVIRSSSNNRQLILSPSYMNITKGLSVTSVNPPTVTVIVSGSPEQLGQLNRANTLLDLDLRGSLSGINKITLTEEMFKTLEGTEIVSFTPQSLEVTLTKSE